MSQLIQIIYSSAASRRFDRRELTELLAAARRKNQANGVTGMLLYTEGSFFQVLEGESAVVERIFADIAGDERHHQVTVIIKELWYLL